jgi:predicted amidohydrolase
MRLPNKLDYWGYPNARAHENQIYFVFCDASPVGTAGIGRSRILSPVRTRAEAKEAEEIITAKVDLDRLKTMRERYDCSKWSERQPIGAKFIRDAGTLIRKSKFL